MWTGFCSQLNNFFVFRDLFSFSQILQGGRDFPLTINFLITCRCNLQCNFCTAKEMDDGSQELSTAEINHFLGKIKKYKPALFLGGGEPFIRNDIFDILAAIRDNGLKYGIVTNGTLLNKEKIEVLMRFAPEILIFSVYGDKYLCKSNGANTQGIEKVGGTVKDILKKRKKTRVILNSVINENNYDKLEQTILLAKDWGVDRMRFEHLIFMTLQERAMHNSFCKSFPAGDSFKMTTNIQEAPKEDVGRNLQCLIPRIKKKYGRFVLFKPYLMDKEIAGWYKNDFKFSRKCFFINHSLFIKHNGDIVPCQFFLNYVLGNAKKDNLEVIWRSRKQKIFREVLKKGLLPGCKRCCKL
ncbi:MAG: radical SAM protein [Candidatus Omnitrophica bacterium]|nr:radical SAM protein [Candidatus Omnitrophota bacterium]